MDEILKFMKENKTYFLATVDDKGNPQVRAFGTIAEINGNLYIQTGKSKDVCKQIIAHPALAICSFSPATGEWLRLTADGVIDDSIETNTAMLDQYPDLKKMYAPGDGNCTCIRLDNIKATISSFTAPQRTLA